MVSWLSNYWGWSIAAIIVALGLFVIGRHDVARFSLKRAWAISSVCFAESIRKKVLWITPLAIIGVIGITQFQRALDEQDAVRQSVKVCIFASGVLVMLTSIILACTNLPKEIESRVIYTIVTKPMTRLELVLGKVIGFARVSLAILVIMGLFTWGYMRLIAYQKHQEIANRLQEGDVSDTERARLSEYEQTGLLTARTFWAPDQLGMYGDMPDPNSTLRTISNGGDEDVLVGYVADRRYLFGPPREDVQEWANEGIGANGLVMRLKMDYVRTGPPTDQEAPQTNVAGPVLKKATTQPQEILPPKVGFQLFDEDRFDMCSPTLMVGGSTPEELWANMIDYARTKKVDIQRCGADIRLSGETKTPDGDEGQFAYAWIPPTTAITLFNHSKFYVRIYGTSAHVDYEVSPKPVSLFVPEIRNGHLALGATEVPPAPGLHGEPEFLTFRGRPGIHGDQELSGGEDAPRAVAVFSFRNAPPPMLAGNQIAFQFNAEVDRSNSEVESGREDPTTLDVAVIDGGTKKITPLTVPWSGRAPLEPAVLIESRLPSFFTIPADAVTSGDYDIVFHCRNTAQTVGLFPTSLQLVIDRQWFEVNLVKSLFILWMMSILVIILSVLCSTFLSWPIAVVLTVMLLLGHWGVDQLADTSGPGLGRQLVNDFKFTDVALSSVVSTGVDSLSRVLNVFGHVLPDTTKFDAIDDIEQGVSVSGDRMAEALTVLLGFGIPSLVLAYLIMLGKEVAP